jgi:hypothetical protein
MKTVMSGAVLAAILTLAMPAWAQAPGTQPSQEKSAQASMPHTPTAHKAKRTHARKTSQKNPHHAAMRHGHRTTASRGGAGPTDNVANQLNRAEAQRGMTGGSTPPMNNPNMAPINPPSQPMPGQ